MFNIQPFLNPTRGFADTAAYYLRADKEDGYAMQGAKLAAGLLNSAIVVLGTTETALTTTITAIAYPALWYFSPETLDSLKNRVSIAFNATLDAAWGMFGYYPTVEIKKEEQVIAKEEQKEIKKEEQVITKEEIKKEEVKKEPEVVVAKKEQEEVKKEPEVVIAKKEQEEVKKEPEVVVAKKEQEAPKNAGRFARIQAGIQNFFSNQIGG